MSENKKDKIKIAYLTFRILMFVSFLLNLIGIFLSKDDSQTSRLAFNAFQSILFVLCTFIPNFLENKIKVKFPSFLVIVFLVVCVCHFILGEIQSFYVYIKGWDSILHTFTGMMLAILAYSIINSLNDNTEGLKLSPFFVAIFAICFTVTIGVLWEIVEFILDDLTGSNMQRYMNSITLEPFSGREALKDTMKDLILDTVGAVIIATIGYFVMKKKEKAFSSLVIKKINDSEKKKGEIK